MDKNRTRVTVKGVKTHALIDTGADISCMSEDFLNKIGLTRKVLNTTKPHFITGVTQSKLKVLGTVKIPISFKGAVLNYTVHVVENFSHSLILGYDLMKDNNASINISTNDDTVRVS